MALKFCSASHERLMRQFVQFAVKWELRHRAVVRTESVMWFPIQDLLKAVGSGVRGLPSGVTCNVKQTQRRLQMILKFIRWIYLVNIALQSNWDTYNNAAIIQAWKACMITTRTHILPLPPSVFERQHHLHSCFHTNGSPPFQAAIRGNKCLLNIATWE